MVGVLPGQAVFELGVCTPVHLTLLEVMVLSGALPVHAPSLPLVLKDSPEVVVLEVFEVLTEPAFEIPGAANVTVAVTAQVMAGSGGGLDAAPAVTPETAITLTGIAIAAAITSILRIMCAPCSPVSPRILRSGDGCPPTCHDRTRRRREGRGSTFRSPPPQRQLDRRATPVGAMRIRAHNRNPPLCRSLHTGLFHHKCGVTGLQG